MKVLKELRGTLSQQEIADNIGITQRAYSNYERGSRQCDYDTLVKLSDYFKVSIDYLITGKETPTTPPKSWLDDIFDSLSDHGKKLVVGAIEGVYRAEKGEQPDIPKELRVEI